MNVKKESESNNILIHFVNVTQSNLSYENVPISLRKQSVFVRVGLKSFKSSKGGCKIVPIFSMN